MNYQFMQNCRDVELERLLPYLKPAGRVLEIGAGSGRQAARLERMGFQVRAIDVSTNPYAGAGLFPVDRYDGRNIPYPDGSFDVVLSLHVLEHVEDPEYLQAEIRRVLSPEGRAVHALPSVSCRIWSILLHYPAMLKLVLERLGRGRSGSRSADPIDEKLRTLSRRELAGKILTRVLVPSPHGVRGNLLSELYYFSSSCWKRFFQANGWHIERHFKGGIYYSQHLLMGSLLGTAVRESLSKLMGSSSIMFVLSKGSV